MEIIGEDDDGDDLSLQILFDDPQFANCKDCIYVTKNEPGKVSLRVIIDDLSNY